MDQDQLQKTFEDGVSVDLPNWIIFDANLGKFWMFPTIDHLGKEYVIRIKEKGLNSQAIFSISVTNHLPQ